MKAIDKPIVLSNNPCIHGLIENWCALCKQKAGDKHSLSIIKAYTPKTIRRYSTTSAKTSH